MRWRFLPSACVVLLLTLPSSLRAQDFKVSSLKGSWSSAGRAPFQPLADVAEAEPNDSPLAAQALNCGDAFRPASLSNGAARDSDWIAFSASAGSLITFSTGEDVPGSDETDTVIDLFASDGTSLLARSDDDGTSRYSRISNFVAFYTGIYYGRIRGFAGAEGSYRADVVCAAPPPVPDNDVCASAVPIACGAIALSGNSLSAANDYDLCPGEPQCASSCTGFHSPGRDVAYRIDVLNAGLILDVTYAVSPSSVDASLYLVRDCGSVATTCAAGMDTQTGQPSERLVYTFATEGTYYLILDAFTPGAGGSWTLNGVLDCTIPVRSLSWGRLKIVYR